MTHISPPPTVVDVTGKKIPHCNTAHAVKKSNQDVGESSWEREGGEGGNQLSPTFSRYTEANIEQMPKNGGDH